ncbi:hypothetical protein RF55_8623 [Lasius niger]|uniref:Uncharacterized protein n=1 Tax=Lasius niger TaxID=67767 RepID=A0A0J7KM88_LASNI|nr:hypothetical protein RF55_8623 [Lasius niger]
MGRWENAKVSVEVDSQYGSMLAEKEESGRERWMQTAASKYEPKEYELYGHCFLSVADAADGRRDSVGLGTNRDGDGKDGSSV